MTICANQTNPVVDCPCTYQGCPRHGQCCRCVKHHQENDQLPACYFSVEQEKVYDRSVAFFMACRAKRP
jgi:hypothetical protein